MNELRSFGMKMQFIFGIVILFVISWSNAQLFNETRLGNYFQNTNWDCPPPGICNQKQFDNLLNLRRADGIAASCFFLSGTNFDYTTQLNIIDFNFSIPLDATINGIEVQLLRSSQAGDARDYSVFLRNLSGQIGDDYCTNPGTCNTTFWLSSNNGQNFRTDVLGSNSFRWNLSPEILNPSLVNSPNFGVALIAYRRGGNVRTLSIDTVKIIVHYSFPPNNGQGQGEEEGGGSSSSSNGGAIAAGILIPLLLIGLIVAVIYIVEKNRPGYFKEKFAAAKTQINASKPDLRSLSPKKSTHDVTLENGNAHPPADYRSAPTANEPSSGADLPPAYNRPSSNGRPASPSAAKPLPVPPSESPRPGRSPSTLSKSEGRQTIPIWGGHEAPVESQSPPKERGRDTIPIWGGNGSSPQNSPPKNSDYVPRTSIDESDYVASSILSSLPEKALYRSTPIQYSANILFGVPLEHARKEDGVPVAVEDCVRLLEEKGLTEEGILRVAGNSIEVKNIREQYDAGKRPDLSKFADIHTIAGVLKLYFRELKPGPLLMTKGLRAVSDGVPDEEVANILYQEFQNIPEVNYVTLKRLFGFLYQVACNVDYNKMTPDNIGVVFAPTLKLPIPLIAAITIYYEHIFV